MTSSDIKNTVFGCVCWGGGDSRNLSKRGKCLSQGDTDTTEEGTPQRERLGDDKVVILNKCHIQKKKGGKKKSFFIYKN